MTDLHVILFHPLHKNRKKFIISHSINQRRPLELWENNRVNIALQTPELIVQFNKELTDLHPVFSPFPLNKI